MRPSPRTNVELDSASEKRKRNVSIFGSKSRATPVAWCVTPFRVSSNSPSRALDIEKHRVMTGMSSVEAEGVNPAVIVKKRRREAMTLAGRKRTTTE